MLDGIPAAFRISAHHPQDAAAVIFACLLHLRRQKAGLYDRDNVWLEVWEGNFWTFLEAVWNAAEAPSDADLESLGAAAEVAYRLQDPVPVLDEVHPMKESVCSAVGTFGEELKRQRACYPHCRAFLERVWDYARRRGLGRTAEGRSWP